MVFWIRNPASRGIFSSPALTADGQYLVLGQGFHEDANSELICLDARTGRVHWLAKTPLHIEGSPAIEGDLVVVGAGAIEEGEEKIVRGHPGLVLAVRISDGQKLWEYQVNDPEPSAAVADGVAYVGAGIHGQAVLALRTETDAALQEKGLPRLLWKASTPAPVTSAITLTEELVLVGCGHGDYVQVAPDPHGTVVALDRQTGVVRWEVPTEDAVFGPIAVRNGTAFCPVRSGQTVALDINASGRVLSKTASWT
jgi:outer membrane protein assembly factor BamB